jgi:hypothetical protein
MPATDTPSLKVASPAFFTAPQLRTLIRTLNVVLERLLKAPPSHEQTERATLENVRLILLRSYALLLGCELSPSESYAWPRRSEQLAIYAQLYHSLITQETSSLSAEASSTSVSVTTATTSTLTPPSSSLPSSISALSVIPTPHLMSLLVTWLVDVFTNEGLLAQVDTLFLVLQTLPSSDHFLVQFESDTASYFFSENPNVDYTALKSRRREYLMSLTDITLVCESPLHSLVQLSVDTCTVVSILDVTLTLCATLWATACTETEQQQVVEHLFSYTKLAPSTYATTAFHILLILWLRAVKSLLAASSERNFFGSDSGTSSQKEAVAPVLRSLAQHVAPLVSAADSITRRLACEILALISVGGLGEAHAHSLMTNLGKTLQQSHDKAMLAGCALTLALLHRQLGGIRSGPYLARSVTWLTSLVQSTLPATTLSSPTPTFSVPSMTHVWALHALWLLFETAGVVVTHIADRTLSLLCTLTEHDAYDWSCYVCKDLSAPDDETQRCAQTRVMTSAPPTLIAAHLCIARLLGALITTLGPDLRPAPRISPTPTDTTLRIYALLLRQEMAPWAVVRAECLAVHQKLILFASHIIPLAIERYLCHLLAPQHVLAAHSYERLQCIVATRLFVQWLHAKEQLPALLDYMLTRGTLERVIIPLLDYEDDVTVRRELKALVIQLLEGSHLSHVSSWVAALQRILQGPTGNELAANRRRKKQLDSATAMSEDEGGRMTVNDEDDDAPEAPTLLLGTSSDREGAAKTTLPYPNTARTKALALVWTTQLVNSLLLSTAAVRQSTARNEALSPQLSDTLVSMAFTGAMSALEKVRLHSLVLLAHLLVLLHTCQEPDDEEPHKLRYTLSKYIVRIIPSLRQGIQDIVFAPLLLHVAYPTFTWFVGWIAQYASPSQQRDLKKYVSTLLTPLATLSQCPPSPFASWVHTRTQRVIHTSLARLYCTSVQLALSSLLDVFSVPVKKQLYTVWIAALKEGLFASDDERTLVLSAVAHITRTLDNANDISASTEDRDFLFGSTIYDLFVASTSNCASILPRLDMLLIALDHLLSIADASHFPPEGTMEILALLIRVQHRRGDRVPVTLVRCASHFVSALGVSYFQRTEVQNSHIPTMLRCFILRLVADDVTASATARIPGRDEAIAELLTTCFPLTECLKGVTFVPLTSLHVAQLTSWLLARLTDFDTSDRVASLCVSALRSLLILYRDDTQCAHSALHTILHHIDRSGSFSTFALMALFEMTAVLMAFGHFTFSAALDTTLRTLLQRPDATSRLRLLEALRTFVQSTFSDTAATSSASSSSSFVSQDTIQWSQSRRRVAVAILYLVVPDVIVLIRDYCLKETTGGTSTTDTWPVEALKIVLLIHSFATATTHSVILTLVLPLLVFVVKSLPTKPTSARSPDDSRPVSISSADSLRLMSVQVLLRLAQTSDPTLLQAFKENIARLPPPDQRILEDTLRTELLRQHTQLQPAQLTQQTNELTIDMSKYE